MKKTLTRMICALLAVVMAAGMLAGCSLLITDNKRDMQQVVAEVNIGNDEKALQETFSMLGKTLQEGTKTKLGAILETDEIYKRDLVAYFMSYGYNYVSQGYTYAQAFEYVMNDLVNRKLLAQFAIVYYLNAGEVLVDRDSIDSKEGYLELTDGTDGMKLDKQIDVEGYLASMEGKEGDAAIIEGFKYFLTQDEINYANYVVMTSVNSAIDSYESDIIRAESDTDTTTTETRTTPTGANVISDSYYPSKGEGENKTVDYGIYTGTNNVSDCGEYEKLEGSTSYTRTRAYARFIFALRQNYLIAESEKDVSDITALSYYQIELKTQMEQQLINKFYATLNLETAMTFTEATLNEAYATELLAQSVSASESASSFTTTMDSVSDTSFIVYSPENRTYGFVYNILLPFSQNQEKVLDGINYTAGTKEYYAARNTNAALYAAIEAKDQRASWFNGSTDYSFNAEEKGYTDYYKGGSSYLFFEDSYVKSDEGIDRYAGKYPFNGTVDKQADDSYKLTYNKLKIDAFIDEMEAYIQYVSGETASGFYYSGKQNGTASWTAQDGSAFYEVTAADFLKEDGKTIDQSANVYYQGKVSGVDAVAAEDTLKKDTASYKVISAVNELMFAYSTDTGCLNKYYGYSVTSEEDATSYVAEFEFAAQEAIKGGTGTYYVVATDYGWHILYVSFVYNGGVVYANGFNNADRTVEGTFSNLFYQAKKSSATSDKDSQIRVKLNTESVVKLYEKRYEDLSSIA